MALLTESELHEVEERAKDTIEHLKRGNHRLTAFGEGELLQAKRVLDLVGEVRRNRTGMFDEQPRDSETAKEAPNGTQKTSRKIRRAP